MQIVKFENDDIQVIENIDFDFLLTTKEVAKGYGVSVENIRSQKSNHQDELIEGKHFISNFTISDGKQKRKTTVWTKRGVVRLGFFIKSERAKRFRDWAEDLILQTVETENRKSFDLQKLEERAKVLEISEKEFGIFKRVFYEIGITRPEELAITSNRAVLNETGVDFIKLAEKKGVSTIENYFTVTELCQKVIDSDKFSEEAKKLVL